MSPSFFQVQLAEEFANLELRAIARYSTRSSETTWYRVTLEGQEVAFVAIERRGERFVPLQIAVPRELRGRGIGSAVLHAVEAQARSEGYVSVRVWPRSLDSSVDPESLGRWYRARGYQPAPDGADDMEKRVAVETPQRAECLAI